jgi:cell division septal protein FtsQ
LREENGTGDERLREHNGPAMSGMPRSRVTLVLVILVVLVLVMWLVTRQVG